MLKEINAQIQEKNKRIRRVEFEDEEEEDKDEEIVEEKPKEAKPAVSFNNISEIDIRDPGTARSRDHSIRVDSRFSKIDWFRSDPVRDFKFSAGPVRD